VKADEFLKTITPAVQRSRLAPFWDDIVKLRAHGCSLDQVCQFLAANQVQISITGLSKYIRRREAGLPESSKIKAGAVSARSAQGASFVEPEDEGERLVPSHDPRDLDRIFSNKPDLAALAKIAKDNRKAEQQAAKNAALPEEARKITNPAELRQHRKREINLDDYMNAEGD
jgi:hypothetical protein